MMRSDAGSWLVLAWVTEANDHDVRLDKVRRFGQALERWMNSIPMGS